MKTCPDCAEEVQDGARVCRYCGYRFDFAPPRDLERPEAMPPPTPGTGARRRAVSRKALVIGASVLAALVVLAVAVSSLTGDDVSKDEWPERWCDLEVDMTADEVREVMGDPTFDRTSDVEGGFQPQMSWEEHPYHFTAFFDADGRVESLLIGEENLTPALRSEIDCAKNRSAATP